MESHPNNKMVCIFGHGVIIVVVVVVVVVQWVCFATEYFWRKGTLVVFKSTLILECGIVMHPFHVTKRLFIQDVRGGGGRERD
jgi:hypothetical protein